LRDHALNFFDWPHATFFDIGQPAGQRFVQFLCVWLCLEREQLRRQQRPLLRAQATNRRPDLLDCAHEPRLPYASWEASVEEGQQSIGLPTREDKSLLTPTVPLRFWHADHKPHVVEEHDGWSGVFFAASAGNGVALS
jgi:hypothetical protein